MNILLIGILGSGRSTVGKLLAQHLGYRFVELDAMVLEHGDLVQIIRNTPND